MRRPYSRKAGLKRTSGSKGSSALSDSMNMRCIARGDKPLASPEAKKAPELTPTKTLQSVSRNPLSASSSATSAPTS